MNKLGTLSIMQICVLVVGIIAISWAIGSETRVVSGADTTDCTTSSTCSALNGTCGIPASCVSPNKIVTGKCPGGNDCVCCVPLANDGGSTKNPMTICDGACEATASTSDCATWDNDKNCCCEKKEEGGSAGEAVNQKEAGKNSDGGDVPNLTPPAEPKKESDLRGFGKMVLDVFALTAKIKGQSAEDAEKQQKNIDNLKIAGSKLVAGITYAGMVYGLGRALFPLMGLSEGQADAASYSAASAVFVGVWMGGAMAESISAKGAFKGLTIGESQAVAGVTTIVAAAAVATFMYYATFKEKQKIITSYNSKPWEAPFGGNFCELCNNDDLGCSEYQCKSLGQACEIINAGTEEEKCFWKNQNDPEPPEIKPWEEALIDNTYHYDPITASSEGDKGVKIVFEDPENVIPNTEEGCIEAFTPISFGVTLNKPAKCRIDFIRGETFDDFAFDLGNPTFNYNHSIALSLPAPNTFEEENITMENGGEYEYYVKCIDPNGRENEGSFVFKFCVVDTVDTTPPRIAYASPENNLPFGFNISSMKIYMYLEDRKIDTCRWDIQDKEFDAMPEANAMRCDSGPGEMNSLMLWECDTTLNGLNDDVENKFYFRCKDDAGNVNRESYEYILKGSKPLTITEVGPTGTIKGSTDSVNVKIIAKTFAGYDKLGTSWCYFNTQNSEIGWTIFDTTYSPTHSDEESLLEGTYTYYIKCLDLAGNEARSSTTFTVDTDTDAPIVVRAYNDDPYLKIMTDEESTCVYDIVDCTYLFEEGIPMEDYTPTTHFIEWNPNINYYIKCKDKYGNEPAPDKCSIIANPFETYQ